MRFLARRIGFYAVAVLVAVTINFFIPRLMPGNPVEILISRFPGTLTPKATAALDLQFGIHTHQSLVGQYFSYLGTLLHGNLGQSITYYPSSVASVIASSLPWTLVLIGVSTVIAFVLGTLVGILVAWRRGGWLDWLLPATTFFSAVPYFWLALIAITLFSLNLHLLPVSGGYSSSTTVGFNGPFLASALEHALLPALTIVVSSVAGWILGMRNMMITTMAEDYVLTAQAKGLSDRRVVLAYAARNAILPSVSNFSLALGFVVTGSIVLEIVFSYPGIGYVLFNAVTNEDYPLMQGIFLVIALAVLLANFVADLVYFALDPRTRQGG
ncbi:MAG: ABC transporter permease [Actinomycetota bacterium]|nr:ABC transporter permease [Actinomycetota bacterium]